MFKNINETKNFPAASREWKNSIYSYNENIIINAPHNNVAANAIANMVFHLTPHKKVNTKSKRMRNLIKKSTTRQLIVSKPDIKQTSEKAIITIYIFDREKAMYTRRLFFIKNSLYKSTIGNLDSSKKYNSIDNIINSVSNNLLDLNNTSTLDTNTIKTNNLLVTPLIKLKRRLIKKIRKHVASRLFKKRMKNRTKRRIKRLLIKRLSYKLRINSKVMTRVLYKSLLSKKNALNNLFMLKFLKWLLSYFSINASYYRAGKILTIANKGITRTIKIKNNMLVLANNVLSNKGKRGKKGRSKFNKTNLTYDTSKYIKFYRIPSIAPLLQMRLINKILLTHIKIMMVHYTDDITKINKGIRKVFDLYKSKYLMSYAMLYLRKQKLTLSYLVKLYNNKLKYNNLVYGFKWLLGNIYNKDVKLNLVNLKYLHLNSDIFLKAISIKLRKKNGKILRILKRALKLVKLPKIISHSPAIQKTTKFSEFDWYMNESNFDQSNVSIVKPINNMLDNLLFNMFPHEISYNQQQLAHNIIYSIKHKWVRGARLEAKGRLTKRYTASRSIFKFRYKGNLRNLEHLKKPNYTREQASVVMLRNIMRPNIQHTFTAGRKRIGVYGIKGWISGY